MQSHERSGHRHPDRHPGGDFADEQHDLDGNALAEKTVEIVERLRPHLNTILLAAAGAVVAIAAAILVSSQAAATKAQAWDAYLAGLSTGEVQSFDEVIRRYPNTPAAEWSRLVLADMALTEGTELLFIEKTRATPRLQAAGELYSAILAGRPSGMLGERATFGLAKARESLGQLEEARQGYAVVASEFSSGPLARIAAYHAAELNRESTRQWYDWFAAQQIKPPAPPAAAAAGGEPPAAQQEAASAPATDAPASKQE